MFFGKAQRTVEVTLSCREECALHREGEFPLESSLRCSGQKERQVRVEKNEGVLFYCHVTTPKYLIPGMPRRSVCAEEVILLLCS